MASVNARFCCDDETGETVTYNINDETGERITTEATTYYLKTSELLPEINTVTKYNKFPKGHVSRTKEFQLLKANIIAGSNTLSYRMLLIPTALIFPAFLCVFLCILEIYLHLQCHKRNKTLKDPNMYYRSPFHVVTCNFCALCRDCDAASKVGLMQDKRKYRHNYLKGIAI